MQNSEYWEKRFLLLNEMLLQKGENYIKNVQKDYANVMENIEKDINDFYMRFAQENNITFQQAKQILTTSERKAFQMKLHDYIKYGSQNGLSKEWVKKLENASTVHRITRLQALQYQFRQQVEKLEAIKEHGLTNTLKDIYKEGYYRTAYEIQRASGIGSAFSRIDETKMNKVLAKPWAPDGKNFSERIWGKDRTQLLYQLENRFSQGMIRGESPQKIIKDIQKALNSSEYATRRLVMTESAFFASASRKETYDKLEVKQYKILAVLDTKTSTICRDMDGKVFDVKDYQPGLNANPFHANCRTTTTPYFNDKFTQQQERSARDENGKTYYVPANMTYKEWYNKSVESSQKVSAKQNIDNTESLQKQQMKQLQDIAQQQKEQLEQLQTVINQQKQQLKQLQNATKTQSIDNVENIKNKKVTKEIILKQHTAPDINHDSIDNIKNIKNQQKQLSNAEIKMQKSEKEFAQLLKDNEQTDFVVNMRFYNETTEHVLNKNLNAPFAYNKDLDVIEYNPFADNFERYNMNYVQAHELAHRMDELQYHSWENDKFIKAVENTMKKVYNNVDIIETWFAIGGKYEKDVAFSDIFSALSKGELNDILSAGHPIDYWVKNEILIIKEIFANITSIDILNSKSKTELKKFLSEMYEAYKELI